MKALLAAIERNSAWVGRQRDAVEFSPKDLASCEAFLSKERAARQVLSTFGLELEHVLVVAWRLLPESQVQVQYDDDYTTH